MVSSPIHQQTKLSQYVSNINYIARTTAEEPTLYAIMFISFDIENSSIYKTKHKENWADTLRTILRNVISTFETSSSGGYDFWKLLGDEVIYTKKIYALQEVADTLEDVYGKMRFINQMMEDAIICDTSASQILAVKATAWICDVSTHTSLQSNNVYSEYEIKDNRKQSDFAGADFDIGFRISHYSMKNRLMISCKLAYILFQTESLLPYAHRVKILDYQTLSGVWNGAPYPIITYHGDSATTFEESILTEDAQKHPLLQTYLQSLDTKPKEWNPQYPSYDAQALIDLCAHQGLTEGYDRMLQLIHNQPRSYHRGTRPLRQVHCTVASYGSDQNGSYFLLAKKPEESLWSIPSLTLYLRSSGQFVYDLQNFFEDEFSIQTTIQMDDRRHIDIPLAVGFYEHIQDNGQGLHGEVLLGQLQDNWASQKSDYEFMTIYTNNLSALTHCKDGVIPHLKQCASILSTL